MAEQIFSNTVGIEGASFSMEDPPQCPQLNVSMCHFTEGGNDQLLIAVYNPLPRSRDIRLRWFIGLLNKLSDILKEKPVDFLFLSRLPVPNNKMTEIMDTDGNILDVQYIPIRQQVRFNFAKKPFTLTIHVMCTLRRSWTTLAEILQGEQLLKHG